VSPRITIVGGGSYHWTPRLLLDFANTPSLTSAEVVLHDVDRGRAARMEQLGNEIARRRGIGLHVHAEAGRRPALAGADFVVTAFSVGGFASMRHDIEIPSRFGIRQPIGDSVGPGGVMRALRSIPVLLDIAHDVEAVAPGAWLLNVTNPLTALCRAVTRETAVKCVGLCNEWVGCTWMLSLLLDCGMHEIDAVLGGVNHFPMATDLRARDGDGFACLRSVLDDEDLAEAPIWMDPPAEAHWEKVSPADHWTKLDVVANNAVRFEMFRRFGVLPGAGDHHIVEFVPNLVHPHNDYGRTWRVRHYGMDGHRRDADLDVAFYEEVRDSREVPRVPSGELVAATIDAMVTGTERHLPVNVPNAGNVGNVGDGHVVEIMGVVGGHGVRGRDATTVPGVLGEYLRRAAVAQEWTVDAALHGDRALALEAMLADAQASQIAYDEVVAMTGEMLDATAGWLPRFRR
jgi:alpha-galactosidase